MTPDLESLRCFVSVAARLNFRQAAADVHLSPAALSSRIRQLEALLGAQLLARTTRAVRITDAGIRLLPHARQLLASAEACARVVADTHVLPYELMVGTRFELGMSWLLPALPVLDRSVPHRTIHVRFGDSADLTRHLGSGELDAVVTSSDIASSQLSFAPLHREDYMLVAAPKLLGAPARDTQTTRSTRSIRIPPRRAARAAHVARAARAQTPTADQLAQWTLLDIGPSLPLLRYLTDLHGTSAWTFGKTRYLGSIAAIREWVLRGLGVAVLPHYYIKTDLAARKLVAIMPPHLLGHDYFRLVWRHGHARTTELEAFAAELRAIELT